MSQIIPIFKREFLSYFRSPVAYVFLVVFLLLSIGLAWFVGDFFKGNLATLRSYFEPMPWVLCLMAPAAGMRLWSEEKRSSTMELLFTLPITPFEAVTGKFLASWAFLTLGILLSFPMILTVAYLGNPDWYVVVSSYAGTILMAGAYLGICSLTSALTKNQVISFVISVLVCLVLVFLGWSIFNDLLTSTLPVWAVDTLANFSFKTHFDAFMSGLIDLKDIVFFVSLTAFALCLNILALER